MPKKQKSVRFRCPEEMYDFIEKLRSIGRAEVNKRDRSEVVRNLINTLRMAWIYDQLDLSMMTEKLKEKLKEDDGKLPYNNGD